MKPPVFLRVYLDGKLESVKQSADSQIVIGQNTENQISLKSELVSPIHAVIEERDSGYYISDLGSESGTFKNGKKIFDENLVTGDEIVVGPYKIEFFVGVPKPTKIPAAGTHPIASQDKSNLNLPNVPLKMPSSLPLDLQSQITPILEKKASASTQPEPLPKETAGAEDKANETVRSSRTTVSDSINMRKSPLTQSLRPSSGGTVEIVVAWRERILATHHFTESCEVTIGSDQKSTIQIPILGVNSEKYKVLTVNNGVFLHVAPEMTGDYFKENEEFDLADLKRNNRLVQTESGFLLNLQQSEMVRLGLHGNLISVYVRFVEDVPKPVAGPLFDLTASEQTAILMSFVIAAIFGLYMWIYSPKPLTDDINLEEPIRMATITFNPPPKKEIVQLSDSVPQDKKIVKVDMKQEKTTTKKDAGTAAALRPSAQNKKTPVVSSTVDQGKTINTGKAAANAQSETRDVTKMGLLSTFGGKGTQNQLSKAYSGAGELLGEAAKATGNSGSDETRAGESLGGRTKNVGAGGQGTATFGISGVGTQGKGTGTFGAGSGGIGKRGRVDLNIGEAEAEFSGTIDREAILRIIRQNTRLFQNCYNQALRRNSDAYGKVEVTWNIEEGGKATKAVVKSNSVGDNVMGDCLARAISGLIFPEPPPDQIAEVTFPFVFASQ